MTARRTILVVDDDPDIAEVMREMLAAESYRVFVALSIDAARDILAAVRVNLVITDAFHPGIRGDVWSPLRRLIDAAPGQAFILCSAREAACYADFADYGIAAYLSKPFNIDNLLALVATLTAGSLPEADTGHPGIAREGCGHPPH